MKKILFFGLILIGMASCSFSSNTTVGTTIKTVTVKVNSYDWKYSNMDNNNYYYCGLDLSSITSEVFEKGEVKAYLVQDRYDYNYARKHALPYVMHKEELVGMDWIFYTETIDFTYGKGWVEFNYRVSDFAYEVVNLPPPPAMEFDIVITTNK